MNQLFCIDPEIFRAMDDETVTATAADLREMGLYHLPYDCVDVAFPFDLIVRSSDKKPFPPFGPSMWLRVPNVTIDSFGTICQAWEHGKHLSNGLDMPMVLHSHIRDFLITVLASRNVVKEFRPASKAHKLGIGKPKPATTYIRLAETLPTCDEHTPTGRTVRPHLRRGHIRNQRVRHGHKRVWIEPCFVNADATFVETRKAYDILK